MVQFGLCSSVVRRTSTLDNLYDDRHQLASEE
jgi:hypothetical protein